MAASARYLFAWCVVALLVVGTTFAQDDEDDDDEEGAVDTSGEGINCEDGLLIPIWKGHEQMAMGDRFGRGVLYIALMIYLFIGVAIASDKFMESIEMITAQEKEVSIKDPKSGKTQTVVVKVWNDTVANLTLMALGSSAPEIMLSVIEIMAKNFKAGDLGPGTIVGSAAFNLFMIIGLCMYVIPDDEIRKIKCLRVFFITATWSVFAYVWLYLILGAISYGKVETWEGILTFLFFPATVYTAYVADKRMFFYKYLDKKAKDRTGVVLEAGKGGDIEARAKEKFNEDLEDMDPALAEFERSRRAYIEAMKRIRLEDPNISLIDLETKAREEVMSKGPKSRAYYRAQATRKMAGKEDANKAFKKQLAAEAEAAKADEEAAAAEAAKALEKRDDGVCRIFFDPPHYTVMESAGTFEVTIVREGGDMNETVQVDYKTEDGTASSEGDYIEAIGTLTFGPGETSKHVTLEVLDDDVFEEDEHFYIRISNLRRKDGRNFKEIEVTADDGSRSMQACTQLGTPHMATIMILDDDHSGIFSFEDAEAEIVESVGVYEVKVQRISGARGKVAIPYSTEDGTAKEGVHYEAVEGELLYSNEETEKIIEIPIIDEEAYEKNLIMYVNIDEPRHIAEGKEGEGVDYSILDAKKPEELTEEEKIALLGRPCLGNNPKLQIRIRESREFKSSVDRMMAKSSNSILAGSSSWLEQFTSAFEVQADDDEEGEEGEEAEEKMPSCGDYIMHFLTLPWKLIFALIPPTGIFNGYPTFVISIAAIGLVTAVIGDVAGHLGCFIYLKDCVNAIGFVALGTSVPDTFASKTAAIEDDTADNSVGNVTGSNAVNVFLGIGIAWTIAAIYWESQGLTFDVPVGSLGFSVTVFCIEAGLAILILVARRHPAVGGELGGPKSFKTISSGIFVFFWCFYVAISAMEAYGVIDPGF
jgi:solute carrier family 8 (sodium/calcium exchanger)